MLKKQFLGKWRIVSMAKWDNDYVDQLEPGYIEFYEHSSSGCLHFGFIYADIHYRTNKNNLDNFVIEFSFQGDDEGDEISGYGNATVMEKSLEGNIYFHHGDESSFIAEPFK